jgi:hypothetical protein
LNAGGKKARALPGQALAPVLTITPDTAEITFDKVQY